jgi:hypothetical protein
MGWKFTILSFHYNSLLRYVYVWAMTFNISDMFWSTLSFFEVGDSKDSDLF